MAGSTGSDLLCSQFCKGGPCLEPCFETQKVCRKAEEVSGGWGTRTPSQTGQGRVCVAPLEVAATAEAPEVAATVPEVAAMAPEAAVAAAVGDTEVALEGAAAALEAGVLPLAASPEAASAPPEAGDPAPGAQRPPVAVPV